MSFQYGSFPLISHIEGGNTFKKEEWASDGCTVLYERNGRIGI